MISESTNNCEGHHVSELDNKDDKDLIALLRGFQRQTASSDVAIANVPERFEALATKAIEEGFLLDALFARGSLRDRGIAPLPKDGRLFQDKVYEVRLDLPESNDPDEDQEDDYSPRR